MVYCAGKLLENLKFLYRSNRPHFRRVYQRDNLRGMLGEHEKSLKIAHLRLAINHDW